MTFAEIEVSLKRMADHQIVQGQMLNRVEQAVERNTEAITRNSEAIGHLAESLTHQADGLQVMQAAMQKLFEHMDRFIHGLEGNGRRPA
ncbi:MAG: hypothetical protein ACRD1O_11310 [Terriglobia bacterium]